MFKEISNAYRVLSDAETRKVCDKFEEEGLQGSGMGTAPELYSEDMFRHLFGGSFFVSSGSTGESGHHSRRPARGKDIFCRLWGRVWRISLKESW